MLFKVFINAEFTDFIGTHLISIGMVADSGEKFYVEVPYPDQSCSSFVREMVLPLLGRYIDAACQREDLRGRMTAWLNRVRPPDEDIEICFDYWIDWKLFSSALECQVPTWCQQRTVNREINGFVRYQFHKHNNLPEHHALYDALALQYSFQEWALLSHAS